MKSPYAHNSDADQPRPFFVEEHSADEVHAKWRKRSWKTLKPRYLIHVHPNLVDSRTKLTRLIEVELYSLNGPAISPSLPPTVVPFGGDAYYAKTTTMSVFWTLVKMAP